MEDEVMIKVCPQGSSTDMCECYIFNRNMYKTQRAFILGQGLGEVLDLGGDEGSGG
jgi:hypothetical protein